MLLQGNDCVCVCMCAGWQPSNETCAEHCRKLKFCQPLTALIFSCGVTNSHNTLNYYTFHCRLLTLGFWSAVFISEMLYYSCFLYCHRWSMSSMCWIGTFHRSYFTKCSINLGRFKGDWHFVYGDSFCINNGSFHFIFLLMHSFGR
jgi:hypothetical protein